MADALYDVIIGATTISQVTNVSVSEGLTKIADRTSGAVAPSEIFISVADPRAQIETLDLATVFGGFNVVTGLHVSGGTWKVPFRKRANGGTFGGNVNYVFSGTDVHALLTTLNAQRGSMATLGIDLDFKSSDGLTAAIAYQINQTLASTSYIGCYSLGPCYIGTTLIPTNTGVSVTFGSSLLKERYGGANWPTASFVNESNPTMTVNYQDLDITDGREGGAAVTTVTQFLRKMKPGGTYEAAGDSAHIKIVATGGIINLETASAQGTDSATASFMITAETLSVSTAQAITAPT
jgi:hypothetical protein